MLNNMVASFTASNLVGESMKSGMKKPKTKTIEKHQADDISNENTETEE
jgi:hypothetical protein